MTYFLDVLSSHVTDISATPGIFLTLILLCALAGMIDMQSHTIPNWLLFSFLIVRVMFFLPPFSQPFSVEYILGFQFAFALIFIPAVIISKPMGGDIKLASLLGFYLGIGLVTQVMIVALILFLIYAAISYIIERLTDKSLPSIKEMIDNNGPDLRSQIKSTYRAAANSDNKPKHKKRDIAFGPFLGFGVCSLVLLFV